MFFFVLFFLSVIVVHVNGNGIIHFYADGADGTSGQNGGNGGEGGIGKRVSTKRVKSECLFHV